MGFPEYLARCRASAVAGVQTLEVHGLGLAGMRHSILVAINITASPMPEPWEYRYGEGRCAASRGP